MKAILQSLIIASFIAPVVAQASDRDELCTIRPDLCDDAGTRPAHRTIATRPAANSQSTTRKPASISPQRTKVSPAKCRVAGQPYPLDSVDLPVCKSQNETLKTAPVAKRPAANPATAKKVATAQIAPIDFDSYMLANQKNPAVSHHGSQQGAFQEVSRPVSFNFSAAESGVRELDTTAAPAQQAGAPAVQQQAAQGQAPR